MAQTAEMSSTITMGLTKTSNSDKRSYLRMGQSMKGNGKITLTSDKDKEHKFGQTDLCMKVGGLIAKPMDVEDLSMLMEIFTMVTGRTTKLTVMDATVTWMEQSIKEIGKKINNTDKV